MVTPPCPLVPEIRPHHYSPAAASYGKLGRAGEVGSSMNTGIVARAGKGSAYARFCSSRLAKTYNDSTAHLTLSSLFISNFSSQGWAAERPLQSSSADSRPTINSGTARNPARKRRSNENTRISPQSRSGTENMRRIPTREIAGANTPHSPRGATAEASTRVIRPAWLQDSEQQQPARPALVSHTHQSSPTRAVPGLDTTTSTTNRNTRALHAAQRRTLEGRPNRHDTEKRDGWSSDAGTQRGQAVFGDKKVLAAKNQKHQRDIPWFKNQNSSAEKNSAQYERVGWGESENRPRREMRSKFKPGQSGMEEEYSDTRSGAIKSKTRGAYSNIRSGGAIGYAQASIMQGLKQAKKQRDYEEAKRILDEALERPDAADVVDVFVYSAALGVFAKSGKWEAALKMLSDIKERGVVKPNHYIYNQAIMACGNGGQWKWAVYLLKVMAAVGVKPDVISYNSAISGCAKVGQYEVAVVLLREMADVGIVPNVVSYNGVLQCIEACQIDQYWERAHSFLKEMQEKGIKPDIACYESVIASCATGGQTDLAVQLIQQMQEQEKITPNLKSYNAAIAACESSGEWERAVILLRQMQEKGTKPDDLTYRSVVKACKHGKQYDLAQALTDENEK